MRLPARINARLLAKYFGDLGQPMHPVELGEVYAELVQAADKPEFSS